MAVTMATTVYLYIYTYMYLKSRICTPLIVSRSLANDVVVAAVVIVIINFSWTYTDDSCMKTLGIKNWITCLHWRFNSSHVISKRMPHVYMARNSCNEHKKWAGHHPECNTRVQLLHAGFLVASTEDHTRFYFIVWYFFYPVYRGSTAPDRSW